MNNDVEYCPKINGLVSIDKCNKCECLGVSRWSMKPVCRYEEKPEETKT